MTVTATLLSALRRQRRVALALFLLLAGTGVGAVLLRADTYEATVKLLVNAETLPLSLSRAELFQPSVTPPTVETMTTLVEIVTARDLIEQLVDDLGAEAFAPPAPSSPLLRALSAMVGAVTRPTWAGLVRAGLVPPPDPRRDLIETLIARRTVYPVRQSQVLEIAVTWPGREVPLRVAEHFLTLILARIDALNTFGAEGDVLTREAARAADDLAVAQARLLALQRRHGVVDATAEIARLADRLARLEGAQDALPGSEAKRAPDPGTRLDDLLRRIAALEIDLAGSGARATGASAALREIEARLAAARTAHAGEVARIAGAMTHDRARLADLQAVEGAFLAAVREVDLATTAARAYRVAAQDRRVMQMQRARLHLRVIDPPALPTLPRGAGKVDLLLAVLGAAGTLALLGALVADRLHPPPRRAIRPVEARRAA